MPSPFPGMDPYLEQFWGDVHIRLINNACGVIQRQLPVGLVARMGERVFVEPSLGESEPTTQGCIEIIDIKSGRRVVTVIEFLSPSNKAPGPGRDLYVKRQEALKNDQVSLVEIDLLRAGISILSAGNDRVPLRVPTHFTTCVSPGWFPFEVGISMIPLRGRLPAIQIPLRQSDTPATLDLQALINQAYEDGRYGDDINYHEDPDPPLARSDALWANRLLREKGLRG